VFESAGVTVPVYVVPLGIGDVYQPAPRPVREPFTFLTFGDRGRRKGGHWAMQAFLKAFGDDTRYRLIVKSRTPKVQMNILNPNIEFVQRDMTEEELYQLYLECDALVNPNMGEGFGLIPREFAATGGIALATGWGGTADDGNVWGVPLPYTLVEADWRGAANLEGQDLGLWAQPDVPGVAAKMREVADNRDYYRRRAMDVAPHVRHMYDWRRFAAGVYTIWKGIAHAQSGATRQPALHAEPV
jgi:glycosyltransferase involved in cell wall biosynthesis